MRKSLVKRLSVKKVLKVKEYFMRSINGDKLYRIKVKDGAHVNNHVKEDGSKAAIQFDEENNLQGPVDLIEVDENEYIKEVYTEPIPKER